ncbi:MAG: hydrogenase expression/formation protein [Gammaproteobacteria bacterium]
MSTIELPIFGKGSQPAEEDGAALEYLPLPQAMHTYRMPRVSTETPRQALEPAQALLRRLQQELTGYRPTKTSKPLPLSGLDGDNRRFVDELLGEGEVSIRYSGTQSFRIQESVLAGVWRLQRLDSNGSVAGEWLEVGDIPKIIRDQSFDTSADLVDTLLTHLPTGVMNAPPILSELNAQIAAFDASAEPYVINLSLLPQTEQDIIFLTQRLGSGKVTILSRGYGNCRIASTAVKQVWWVRYYNSEDVLILNTLEVAAIPQVTCAAPEDIEDSALRLGEMLNVYL